MYEKLVNQLTILVISFVLTGGVVYLSAVGKEIPEALTVSLAACVGYLFRTFQSSGISGLISRS